MKNNIKYIICNHKNNFTKDEIIKYKQDLDNLVCTDLKVIVAPSFIYMNLFDGYNLCSQDISAYDRVITGEVSAKELKSMNVSYSIIGHIERKLFLKENYLLLNEKIKQANKNNIRVIYCISDIEKDLDSAKSNIIKELDNIKDSLKKDAIIAYEPKWAIGTNITLDYDYIKAIINYISGIIPNEIVYGGSVNVDNVDKISKIPNIRGFLIGNSLLKGESLQKIIEKVR